MKQETPFKSLWPALLMSLILPGCDNGSAHEGSKPLAEHPLVAPADLVLQHGKIATVDDTLPYAEAIAIAGNRIAAVGRDADIAPYIGASTRVLDITGMLAVPGLIEGHGHFMSLGESLQELDLRSPKTWQDIVNLVQKAVARAEPGDWIVGQGWHQDKWLTPPVPNVEGLPLNTTLNAVSPENPVFLSHTSGHGVFVNARALAIAGITRDTPDPVGGEIVRDERHNPIGMLRETAADPVIHALAAFRANRPPQAIEAERRQQVRLAAREAIENGITSFQDMGSTFETLDFLKKLADEGALPLRLYLSVEEPASAMEGRLADYRTVGYGGGFYTVRTMGEKVLDGALGTHGGWLLEPYADLPRSFGFNVTPVADIKRSAELALANDYQMAIQGIGDRAARELLDIYATAFATKPAKNPAAGAFRWRIEHAQVIHPDDVPRFAQLGVIAGTQGIFACSDGPWVIDRLGMQRAQERGYVFRTLLDAGATVMNGTDPPVEDIDPIASFTCSVTRKLPDGSVFFPQQRLTREQALRSYTLNNAYAAFEENIKGSIRVGKLADITVLSRDILTVADDELADTHVTYTLIDGKVVYRRP